MNKQIVKDTKGKSFEAYVVTLSNGSLLQIETDVADIYLGGCEAYIAREVERAEKVLKGFQ